MWDVINLLILAASLYAGFALTRGRWARELRRAVAQGGVAPVPVFVRTVEGGVGKRAWRGATVWVGQTDWKVEPRFDGPPFDLPEARIVGSRRWARRDWLRYGRNSIVLVCDFTGGRCELLVSRSFVVHLVGNETPPIDIDVSAGKPS